MMLLLKICLLSGIAAAQDSRIINNAPRNQKPFLLPGGDLLEFELSEKTEVGSLVYQLQGKDPEGGALSYTISGDYFSIPDKMYIKIYIRYS